MRKSLLIASLAALPGAGFADTSIASLTELSTDALRARVYDGKVTATTEIDCPGMGAGAKSQIVSYTSDGLNLYARLQRPEGEAPAGGWPVVLFAHGWVGADAAPEYPFSCNEDGYYANVIKAWADAGYAVLMPGYRGHGTVSGKPADGIDWMKTWDNGTYLSPVFYAVDVLNLLAATPGIEGLDLTKIHVLGHSQGGDVAAIVLAATGEGAANGLKVTSAALWSGTYVDRFTQLETYPPMETALEAFIAGDGTWTGTATGADGRVNPNFVFGYPPNWIGTLDQTAWDWQKDQWSAPSVRAAVEKKLDEMYATLNAQVKDAAGWAWSIGEEADGGFTVVHDERLVPLMKAVGAFDLAGYLTEPLNLHYSDRDFYSAPAWNIAFCENANAAGGTCQAFEYMGNTHELTKAVEGWFSPADTVDGWPLMLKRDQALIAGQDPRAVE